MLNAHTLEQLRTLRLDGMLAALTDEATSSAAMALPFEERLTLLVQRNLELIWLTGRLAPDFKTIADFRRDNGDAIRKVSKEFVLLCRRMKLFTEGRHHADGRLDAEPGQIEPAGTCRSASARFHTASARTSR